MYHRKVHRRFSREAGEPRVDWGRWGLFRGGVHSVVQCGGGWRLEIIKRNDSAEGRLRRAALRWIVERTIAWIDRFRRLCKDYERKVQTSEYLIEPAMIRWMLRCPTR
jgi:DDE family transposase